MFGSTSFNRTGGGNNSATTPTTPSLPSTPRAANSTVLLAGLMGLRPRTNPALTTSFASGSGSAASGGYARKPALSKRLVLGGV